MSQLNQDPFVTVVTVGNQEKTHQSALKNSLNSSEYVTVLTISNEENKTIKDVTETVVVYRLPGERLGFGLKFEGGTKAHEYVKRLFIQSCAPDSPASRVQSSWGALVEGDEILEIDSVPISTMTRIDCVRFLKDSNVAIQLLVKHCFDNLNVKQKPKFSEDLPVIVSTEEKKPPPVPPRKLHRKLHKTVQNNAENSHENIVPNMKQETFSNKFSRLQSPRNSFRKKYSPDVSRRLSDDRIGPPDAEVYLDLISQESTLSLSESDDTGSTISTILDRFASLPNTTTSSFAGSLPTTPTSIQKHLDLSYIMNELPDDDLMPIVNKRFNRVEENNNIICESEGNVGSCLQDGNFLCSAEEKEYFNEEEYIINLETVKRPVIIPRTRNKLSNENNSTLPRLVDFVPKSTQMDFDNSDDSKFLDDERMDYEYVEYESADEVDHDQNVDPYNSKWMLSSHLSTIGEDEEEQSVQDLSNSFGVPPQVMVENLESNKKDISASACPNFIETDFIRDKQFHMEIPPSDSRQPPDGHEFPDFIETTSRKTTYSANNSDHDDHPENFKSTWNMSVIKSLDRSKSNSNYDLRPEISDFEEEKYEPTEKSNLMHNRSQSLIDMSVFSKEKSTSKWNTLMEQRKSRLSKLKGLVIPEAAENDVTPLINIPEIKSVTTSEVDLIAKPENGYNELSRPELSPVEPIILQSWSPNLNLPKYSPAFKRKSLQVYSVNIPKRSENSDAENSYDEYINKYNDITPSRVTDDPKSLESIASPTRSDYSFDYSSLKSIPMKSNIFQSNKDYADSDNDSAVSSSQSSYNSRSSPPPSPISEEKLNSQNRMLKGTSVEAINRKNILASAKCRSGKDLKIGSPVIKRKGSVEEEQTEQETFEESFTPRETETEILTSKDTKGKTSSKQSVNEFVEFENKDEQQTVQDKEKSMQIVAEKTENRPLPTKRTHVSSTHKDSKESNFESLLQRHNAASALEKQKKTVNVRNLLTNFENSAAQSLPVFPKHYKAQNKMSVSSPEITNYKPIPTTRRLSADSQNSIKAKSEYKVFSKQQSEEEMPVVEPSRRYSSSSIVKPIPKEDTVKSTNSKISKQERNYADNSKPAAIENNVELRTIELNVDQTGGPLGITLTGGSDCENKNIMIHRIRYGSIAYQDGRLKKGDKVVSINEQPTAGLSHLAATELLKMPISKFSIVIEETKETIPLSNLSKRISSSVTSLSTESKGIANETNTNVVPVNKKPTNTIGIRKDGAGLGFSIEGGKDSPKGDVPLIVKKIFAGGVADKSGELKVGDEILSINKINFQTLSRIEAWSQMKKIPDGHVTIEIYR